MMAAAKKAVPAKKTAPAMAKKGGTESGAPSAATSRKRQS